MDMNQYLEIFIEETREHLQVLNQSLLQLEKNPGDKLMLNEIFRVAHTLKGMSGTMGFSRMARLTHDMEDVLSALRNDEIQVTSGLVDLLFRCLDALESYLARIIETSTEGNEDNNNIIKELSAVIKEWKSKDMPVAASKALHFPQDGQEPETGATDIELNEYDINVINRAAELGNNTYQITVMLNKGCVLKSARAFIVFKTLEKYAEIIKSVPAVQDIEDEKFDFEFTVIAVSKENESVFVKELNSIAEIENVIVKLIKSKKETSQEIGGESPAIPFPAGTADGKPSPDAEQAKNDLPGKKAKTGKTVRVDIERLDVLLNLVSELIIQKTRLEGLEGIERTQSFVETLEYLERITTNLHDAVMKVRMVPVETVFNRFPRMIRDISRDLGKEVELFMSGEETELDRTVIDEIGEPLIHLLRNSCDHGIEPAEKRRSLGKPEVGRIELKAYQDGNNVVIEVSDDGQGINVEKIKKKAVERGLVSKDAADSLTKEDLIDFLFRPNFSTAESVTGISGRGVGLDVVKNRIEMLGGSVEVETESGKGSRFIIRLPLTLAIIQALLVMVGEEKYAIQLSSIQRIIKVKAEEVKLVQNQEVIMYRDVIVPILRLDKVLDVQKDEAEEPNNLTVVIVKRGERLTGLVVDKILGQQEIVQKSLGKYLAGIKIITSATILGDGNVALILDVNDLAS
ncbi:MAG: chemotaxis protein CheW [Bacillota bacterium]